MKNIFNDKTIDFLTKATKRAIRTCCQTALALIGTAQFLDDINWASIVSAAAVSGIVSYLTSIVLGIPEANKEE